MLVSGGGGLVMVPSWQEHSPMASAASWLGRQAAGASRGRLFPSLCGVGAAWLNSAAREQGSGLCQVPGLFLQ